MKAKRIGICALILCLMAGSFAWAGKYWASAAATDPEEASETQEAIEKEYPSLLSSTSKDGEMSKDETVYVISDADGSVKETVVSEWLRNGEALDTIKDVSKLKDIENTANDKTFTQDGNTLVWAADGSDIKYKGSTDEDLPVSVKVGYFLDGQKMSASEIAGKSGNVEIIFTYKVNTSVSADGYEFKTPYTMASGVLLDDEHFTDVIVEGGKVIDDGSKCICLGLAFPNMTSNLNTDLSSLDIPERVSIKAYTDNFEIDGTYTVAMTGLLSDLDLSDEGSIEDKISSLESALGQLGDASSKLVSGASKLSSGAAELDDNAATLKDGAQQLADGTGQLKAGSKSLQEGAGQLSSGASALSDGTAALKDGSASLAEGTGQLKEGAGSLTDGTAALKNGSASLADGTGRLKEGAGSLTDGTAALKDGSASLSQGTENLKNGVDALAQGAADLGTGVSDLVAGEAQVDAGLAQLDAGLQNLSSGGESGGGIIAASNQYQADMEQYAEVIQVMIDNESDDATRANLQALKDQLPMPDSYTSAVKNYVGGVDTAYAGEQQAYAGEQQVYAGMQSLQAKLPALTEGISGLQEGANSLNDGAKSLANGAAAADDGAKALASGIDSADAGAKSLANGAAAADDGAKSLASGIDSADSGAKSLSAGAKSADEGAKALASGASEAASGAKSLAQGASDLDDGATSLADGTKQFKNGTSALSSGARELYDGIKAFDADGIQKLIASLDDAGIEELFGRLKALADASKDPGMVDSISKDMSGQSRIIVKTEAVKAE